MEDVFLSVTAPLDIDLEVFSYWVEGRSVEEAGMLRVELAKKEGGGTYFGLEFPRAKMNLLTDQTDFLKYEVVDQYRAYQILDHYLSQPQLLRTQSVCIITSEVQNVLIEKYWHLDDIFIRELLNKRFAKSRKDVEDICEVVGLNLRRCTRQIENIKQIFNYFEEALPGHSIGKIYPFIMKQFLLPHTLAKKYTCIIFLLYTKFNLTAKRRIQKLHCEALENSGVLILTLLATDGHSFWKFFSANSLPSTAVVVGSSSVGMNSPNSGTGFIPTNANLSQTSSRDNLSREVSAVLPPAVICAADLLIPVENLQLCWNFVWKHLPLVESLELDKQLLNSLRDLRNLLTGEMLDNGCQLIKQKLSAPLIRKLDGYPTSATPVLGSTVPASQSTVNNSTVSGTPGSNSSSSVSHGVSGTYVGGNVSYHKLRSILKALLLLGANLSQSREYRDLFEDIITKIVEPLEESNFSPTEMSVFVYCCYHVVSALPEHGRFSNVAMNSNISSNTSTNLSSHSRPGDYAVSTSSISSHQTNTSVVNKFAARNEALRKDWLRFILFIRLCLLQLVGGDKK